MRYYNKAPILIYLQFLESGGFFLNLGLLVHRFPDIGGLASAALTPPRSLALDGATGRRGPKGHPG